MTAAIDPIPGILACLKLADDLDTLCEGRVYGEEIPRAVIDEFEAAGNDSPKKCIVVSSAAGGWGLGQRSTIHIHSFRADIKCYGENYYEARQVHYALLPVLKRTIGRSFANVLFQRFIPEVAAITSREPDTNWPFVFSSWDVWAAETSTT